MAYQALRSTTGFNGPVITDDLAGMRAITDRLPVPQAVVSAISAGADLALTSDVCQLPRRGGGAHRLGRRRPGPQGPDALVGVARHAGDALRSAVADGCSRGSAATSLTATALSTAP